MQPDRQARAGRRARARGSRTARELDCTLLIDEFYSHYVWTAAARRAADGERRALRRGRRSRSGRPLRRPDQELALPGLARHLDGRAHEVIDAVASAGSFLDGGGCKPLQRAAVPLSRRTRRPRRRPSRPRSAASAISSSRPGASRRRSTACRRARSTAGAISRDAPAPQRRHELLRAASSTRSSSCPASSSTSTRASAATADPPVSGPLPLLVRSADGHN